MALNTTKLGLSGVNALFKQYYGRDATKDELNYWSNKSDAELRPKLIPNSATQLKQKSLSAQEIEDKKFMDALPKNPAIATLMNGGSSAEQIANALSSGNLSGIVDWQGKPFSVADQQAALDQGMKDNQLFYEAQQEKDKAAAESTLAQKQADYQDYLISSGQDFETDKGQIDQTAADSGVLFSGGRVQKEKNLQRAYEQDQASKLATASRNIGQTANDFQYKYGNEPATALNKYYNLGSNAFNPNVATGGVTSNGLSSVYNPGNYSFQGTVKNEQKANANTRAAGYLWNKGNKLLATGYNNKF